MKLPETLTTNVTQDDYTAAIQRLAKTHPHLLMKIAENGYLDLQHDDFTADDVPFLLTIIAGWFGIGGFDFRDLERMGAA